jgi:hypothetical protein
MDISILLPYLERMLEKIKNDKLWKKLFLQTGENILESEHDKGSELFGQLSILFSEKPLKIISQEMKDVNGFRFDDLLKIKMNGVFGKFDLEKDEREKHIDHFISLLTNEIREKDPEFAISLYLKDFREENNAHQEEILGSLGSLHSKFDKQKKENNKNISDIESYLEINVVFDESQQKKVNLDFFNYEDDEFEIRFFEALKNDCIYIKGETVEETIYYILYLLKKKGEENKVLVIRSKEEWNSFDSNIKGKILIPFFYAEEKPAIAGNQIIYVYGKEEINLREPIILEKRKFRNLARKLTELKMDSESVNRIISNTNALFPVLKRRYFKGSCNNPEWVDKIDHYLLIPALLIGTWSENAEDKLFISDLAGEEYYNYISAITNVINSEDPFLIKFESHGKTYYRIANLYEAWEIMSHLINKRILEKFLEFVETIILLDIDPKFDFPEEQHWYINVFEGSSEFSNHLKSGVLRSLIMLNNYNYKIEVNKCVKIILDGINSGKDWFALSEYFNLLIEASPEIVIERIESEIEDYKNTNSSNFMRLFIKEHSNDHFTRNYYINILFGLEKMVFVKKYFSRIIHIIAKLSTFEIDYKIENSPISTLEKVFCAWYQEIDISQEERKKILSQLVKQYPKTWSLIKNILPTRNEGGVYFHLNKPQFLDYQENYAPSNNKNIIETYKLYMHLVLDNSENNLENVSVLFDECLFFEYKLSQKTFEITEKILETASDNAVKFKFYNKLQNIIYKHRHFKNANWAMEEEDINQLEKLFNKIVLENELLKQLYLFNYYSHEVPILNPIPYSENKGLTEQKTLADKLRCEFMEKLENKKDILNYIKLLDKNDSENGEIGRYLPKYYSKNNILDIALINKLDKLDRKRIIAVYLSEINQINPEDIINLVKNEDKNLVSFDVMMIIFNGIKMDSEILQQINKMPDDFKNKFWRQFSYILVEEKEIVQKVIYELLHYNNYLPIFHELYRNDYDISLYIQTLESLSDYLTSNDANEIGDYYILEIFKKIYQQDYEKYKEKIFKLEIKFIKTLSGKVELKMLKKEIERNAANLTELISFAYKKDSRTEIKKELSEEQKIYARNAYSVIACIRFCPFQNTDGSIDYSNLHAWVEEYLENAEKNDQSKIGLKLLGKFLSFSKTGTDEIFPHESIRKIIEEFYSKDLKNGFIDGIIYSRGVYDGTHGVEEQKLAIKYRGFAEDLKEEFVNTSKILYTLSDYYFAEAEEEKKDDIYE